MSDIQRQDERDAYAEVLSAIKAGRRGRCTDQWLAETIVSSLLDRHGDIEALRMAYKTGYQEGVEDSDGNFCREACEEGWQQYLEGVALSEECPQVSDTAQTLPSE